MYPQPPPGQGPIDPRGAFAPPPPPGAAGAPPMAPPGVPPPPFPPAMFMPPPMYMPPSRPPRSFTRGIFLTLATTIFGLSLTLNLYLLIAHGLFSGSSSRQSILVPGDPTQKIAVIPVQGIIAADATERFERFISSVEHDSGVQALVIDIDSPGGTVSASDEIYHRIIQFKKAHPNIPVVATLGGVAASGGYYVACAADYVFAQPMSLTGNIGVLWPSFNVSKLFEKWGIEETTLISKGATFKNAGSMFKPLTPEDREYMQDLIDKAFVQFKTVVATGRHLSPEVVEKLANGKIYTAQDAKSASLIDDIGYATDAFDYVAAKQGLSRKYVVRYQDPPSLRDLLASQSNLPPEGRTNVTINGIKVDAAGLQDLLTPHLMYLWKP
jgi:protease-4